MGKPQRHTRIAKAAARQQSHGCRPGSTQPHVISSTTDSISYTIYKLAVKRTAHKTILPKYALSNLATDNRVAAVSAHHPTAVSFFGRYSRLMSTPSSSSSLRFRSMPPA